MKALMGVFPGSTCDEDFLTKKKFLGRENGLQMFLCMQESTGMIFPTKEYLWTNYQSILEFRNLKSGPELQNLLF